MKAWLKGLDAYWFDRGSPVAFGVFRILIGSLAFINLAMIAIDFEAWFGRLGYVTPRIAERWLGHIGAGFRLFGGEYFLPFDVPRINIYGHTLDDRLTLAIYVGTMVAAFLTAIGLWSRVSSVLLAIGIVSLHHRNPLILHGGDTVLRLGVLYVALGPSGAACSLDRLIGLWKGRIAPGPVQVSLWAQRLVQYNMALIYLTTVWLKWGGNLWREGIATYYPARLNEFNRFWYPDFLRDPPVVYITTYGTLLTELALATLVFAKPLRRWVLLAGLAMHAYIEYTMNIPLFSFVMVSLYVTFYSGEEVAEWARRVAGRFGRLRAILHAPSGMRFRPGPEAAIEAVAPGGLIGTRPDGPHERISATNSADRPISPKLALSRANPLLIPALLPGIWQLLSGRACEPLLRASERSPARSKAARR